jgi:hypothetical protein
MTTTTARDREFRAILNILRIRLESVNEAIEALEEIEGQINARAPRVSSDESLRSAVRPTAWFQPAHRASSLVSLFQYRPYQPR